MFLCLVVAPHNTAYKKAQQPHNSLGQNSFFYLDFLLRCPYEYNPKVTALPVRNPIQYRNLNRFDFCFVFVCKTKRAYILYRDTERIVDYALKSKTYTNRQIRKNQKQEGNKNESWMSSIDDQLNCKRVHSRNKGAHSSACHDEESSS